ncbi:RluA family pseudouridine synthase [Longimicrobium sp.]|uniref:RluA family pseudouridine synthase n=1 Tax=Longimicrobium sp. TaxID=2029185 RepID=UPI002C1009FB|nr:RluA family pseudouridine synthase [Longimicrobium sp.]HSU12754.1 RluA family pseudouridine synthase [Longimicrobium sp.]
MTQRWLEHTVADDEAGRTVQEVLTGPMQVSRRMIQKLTRAHGILLNRKPAFLARKVRAGDLIAARVGVDEYTALQPVDMPLAIVHEDEDVLVIDKSPFVLVHPTSPGQTETLSHGIVHHFERSGVKAKVRPVHRIDRDTSGLVLFAKSAVAHARLDAQLREGGIGRVYQALVDGVVADDAGEIDAAIGRDPRQPNLRTIRPGGEPARTRFRVLERLARATLLELELDTGRTHQIRVHMAHAGHPVLGDRQYGRAGLSLIKRQALHASRLSFTHPATGEHATFDAPLPPDIAAVIERLRAG